MSGDDEKREGIARISAKNRIWLDRGLRLADAYLPHGKVMGEDLHLIPGIDNPSGEPGVDTPTKPNAWGALVQNCLRAGLLIKTGGFKKAGRVLNHSHKYEEYWRPGYPDPGKVLLPERPKVPELPLFSARQPHSRDDHK